MENDKYQEVVIVIIFSIVLFWALIGCIIYFVLQYQRRRFQHAKEKADLQSAFEKDLLQSKIEIQEQAFNDISRELHDHIGQQLSLAKLNLNTLKGALEEKDSEKIDDARNLISDSIYQIRSISKTLLGEKITGIGITEAIRNEAERLERMGLFSIRFSVDKPAVRLDPQKEIILFRIVQEALNNIARHAAATQVLIALTYRENLLEISLEDNGKGFNLEQAEANGVGLLNMRTRAKTIGATLDISSAEQKGTRITITLLNQ